jgi:tripartite-type tricarboxylate transporter receptor subunit TctC
MTNRADNPTFLRLSALLALMSLLAISPHACAQEAATPYPNRPIRMILPVAAGGGTDTLARIIGQGLLERWGKQVVVENRPGAGTLIASDLVAKSKPDGYTLLLTTSTHVINPTAYRKMPYDTLRDFAPITQAVSLPSLIVVHPSVAKSAQELIALAKSRPGEILFASAGRGSNPHLAMALFVHMAQVRMTHVPYKSGPPALIDLIAGHVAVNVSGMSSSIAHVRSGKLRALGITSARRSVAAPDIPTIAEAALPGYEAMQWYGLLAPAGAPRDIIALLHKESGVILRTPENMSRLAGDGTEVVASAPDAFDAFIKAESAKWAQVAKAAGINPE